MSAPVFGYYRRPLVHNRTQMVEARIVEVASRYGCNDLADRIFVELESPIRLLWSVEEFLDQRIDPNIAAQVRKLAQEHGYVYDRMRNYPTPAPALWQLIAALEAARGGIVLVPSIHHLADLETPETVILQHVSKNLNAKVVWIDAAAENAPQQDVGGEPNPVYSRTGQLGEFRVSPFGSALRMARFYCEECLAGSGYAAVAGTIDALMVAVVGPVEQRWSGNVDLLDERLVVRLIKPTESHVLVVEVAETHDYGDASLDSAVRRICDSGIRVRRQRPLGGGTLTRYEVPLLGR